MKKTLKIKNELVRKNAINLVNIIPLDKLHEVIIRPYSETLLQKQRALYWRWVRQYMAPDFGYENYKDLHVELKEQFLVPVLIEHDEGYSDMVDAVISVRRTNPDLADTLKKKIIQLTSIRDEGMVTKLVMSMYMKAVEIHSNKMGCFLPRPGEDG